MPVSVQDLQDELVQDVLATAGTLRDLCREGGGDHTGSHTKTVHSINKTSDDANA